MRAVLILGTNMGDRIANLRSAARRLAGKFGARVDESPVLETGAVGFDGPAFLNQILCYETGISPLELLSACKEIERRMGRTDAPEYDAAGQRVYHDRIIDIDILFYGTCRMKTPELTIPHPQVETRDYVKILLEQLSANER